MSFVWDGITAFLQSVLLALGFNMHGKTGSLLVLGLDNAGKTTLLYRLRTGGDVRSFPPTDRPLIQTFKAPTGYKQSIQFTAWDLGGHEAVRHLWEDYMNESVSAVLFLIDVTDTDRLEEAAYELDALISEELLSGLPIAVLLNKCDLTDQAMSSEEVCSRIEWEHLCSEQIRTGGQIAMYRISVLKGEGYQEAFQWISSFL